MSQNCYRNNEWDCNFQSLGRPILPTLQLSRGQRIPSVLTNEDETGSDNVCQEVASQWFIILAVTFAKEAYERVEFVLTQTLPKENERRHKTNK